MTRIAAILLASATLATGVQAATLRTMTTLDAPVVRISDLFDNAGPGADRVLGPGPAPGNRIVVEAPQLAAIARQFGLDWRPSSAADRAVLDRPGRMLPREDVLAALRAALRDSGAPDDADVELPGFSAPLVAVESHPSCMIEQLDYDRSSGRFTAVLNVSGEGMAMQRMRLSGTLLEMVDVPVPARRLPAGSVIQAEDLQMTRLRADALRGEVARLPTQAVGLAVRHAALPGQPIALEDLGRPAAVQKGAWVTMQLESRGIALVAQGQALQAGGIGERIRVLNPSSRAVVEAEIIGTGRVRVTPGSAPLQAGAAARFSTAAAGGVVP
jgi:flagella basal body P-ring formation protein FlgA